ncbi:MAG: hypothetical protein ACPGVO_21485 [Spirulinaceae cyanobacterium]
MMNVTPTSANHQPFPHLLHLALTSLVAPILVISYLILLVGLTLNRFTVE